MKSTGPAMRGERERDEREAVAARDGRPVELVEALLVAQQDDRDPHAEPDQAEVHGDVRRREEVVDAREVVVAEAVPEQGDERVRRQGRP